MEIHVAIPIWLFTYREAMNFVIIIIRVEIEHQKYLDFRVSYI